MDSTRERKVLMGTCEPGEDRRERYAGRGYFTSPTSAAPVDPAACGMRNWKHTPQDFVERNKLYSVLSLFVENFQVILDYREIHAAGIVGIIDSVFDHRWSDQSLLRCGKFYPASVRSPEDRLRHYSLHFPCVEVDTSTYAIPSSVSISRWVNAVIPGFLFHFKAFGLFCSKSGNLSTIPYKIRSRLPPSAHEFVRLSQLPNDIRDELWQAFNSALQPAYQARCLGVVVFQFHLSFKPSEKNQSHVLWCRKNLDSRYAMAVEFRCRDWFVGEQMSKREAWLSSNSIALISADELEHETFQKDREQTGLAHGQLRVVLPIAWPSFPQDFLYIRVHRREGTQRVLSDQELQSWEIRLGSQLPPGFKGPIYFMWGTDWEDQPLINAKRLSERLPKELAFDWKSVQRIKNRLKDMFMAVSSKVQHPVTPDHLPESAEGTSDSPLTTGLQVQEFALEGEKASIQSTYPDFQSVDEATSPPPSAELFHSHKELPHENVSHELDHKRTLYDIPLYEDVAMNKRVKVSNPPSQVECTDAGLLDNSMPEILSGTEASLIDDSLQGKLSKSTPAEHVSKKAIQAKKLRIAASTPTITSFFKRASRDV